MVRHYCVDNGEDFEPMVLSQCFHLYMSEQPRIQSITCILGRQRTHPSMTVVASAGPNVEKDTRVTNPCRAGIMVSASSSLSEKKLASVRTSLGALELLDGTSRIYSHPRVG